MTVAHRRPIIAGNWKMHFGLKQAVELVRDLEKGLGGEGPAGGAVPAGAGDSGTWGAGGAVPEVVVCPPFTALSVVSEVLKGAKSRIRLGAQDMHWEEKGAFTGEISASMLSDAGCSHVILGHSERRRYFGETDETVRLKIRAALSHNLIPIVCIGETLDERESQKTFAVLERQMTGALSGFAPVDLAKLVLAYEPVWAIGTGRTAKPHQAQESHLFIRKRLARLFNPELAESVRILYGGSVKPDNVDALMAEADIDGALVGGDSLKAQSFLRIVHFHG